MYQNFDSRNSEGIGFCALVNDIGRRIEFHLTSVEGKTYMIALSGKFGQPATRQKSLGPFLSVSRAEKSVKSMCNALVRTGYEQLIRSEPHWQFQVLGEIRKLREKPSGYPGACLSDPTDFYFD